MMLWRWLLMVWLGFGGLSAYALQPVGVMSSPVVDRAALLSDAAESRLRDTLRMVQRRHGSEIVVLTLPSTKPESFEAFSLRVAA